MYMYLTLDKIFMYLTEQNVHVFDLTNVPVFDCRQNVQVFD